MRSFHTTTIAIFVLSLSINSSWAQRLQCQPRSYHFGRVQVGDSASSSFQLVNTGTQVLQVLSVSESGAEFSIGNLQLPVNLNPGESLSLPVTFTPTVCGHVTGTVTITSNDPRSPQTAYLGGTGTSPDARELSVSPSALNFGNVAVGATASLTATLTASNGDVTISSDGTTNSEFAITGLTLPVTIPYGQSVQATIQFTPASAGTVTAQDQFISNAGDSPTGEQLTGTGVSQDPHYVSLSWDPGESGMAGYNIYRGGTHGGPYGQINSSLLGSTSYTDYNVVDGATYYYVATEVDDQGQESGYSNEAEAQIPAN